MVEKKTTIGVVGPCSAGKTTLINNLSQHGYTVKHIAQEHAYVKEMWELIGNPDVLIYLDVSYEQSMRRRPLNMSPQDFDEQIQRLSHAHQHADYYLDTSTLRAQEVFDRVMIYLRSNKIPPSHNRKRSTENHGK
jgi:deoxyadenosine/deoxycytidine kinase